MDTDTIDDEAQAIARVLSAGSELNGDDAASLRVGGGAVCVSTDSTVAGVHAPVGTPPRALGRRAAARALSDLAAMGAAPVALTCAVHVPRSEGWTDAVLAVEGARERAAEQGAELVGGDFTRVRTGALALVVTVLGRRAGARRSAFVMRSGMRPGDTLMLTGALGRATHALARGERLLPEPPDRLRAGIALAPFACAMVDISDGLARDAGHLAASSGCGASVDLDAVPLASPDLDTIAAAAGGDDYELLVAVPREQQEQARDGLRAACPRLALTAIGTATERESGITFHRGGEPVEVPRGFVHD